MICKLTNVNRVFLGAFRPGAHIAWPPKRPSLPMEHPGPRSRRNTVYSARTCRAGSQARCHGSGAASQCRPTEEVSVPEHRLGWANC